MSTKESFLKNHGDTLAIIATTMIICGCIQSLWMLQLGTRIETVNERIDKIQSSMYERKLMEATNGRKE